MSAIKTAASRAVPIWPDEGPRQTVGETVGNFVVERDLIAQTRMQALGCGIAPHLAR
jgi:hypothetical protein